MEEPVIFVLLFIYSTEETHHPINNASREYNDRQPGNNGAKSPNDGSQAWFFC